MNPFVSPLLTGIPIMESNHLGWRTYQYRFPASKSKRIRRKWAKKYLRRVQDPVGYKMPNMFGGGMVIIANDAFLRELRNHKGEP
jgi:hypothetical protein